MNWLPVLRRFQLSYEDSNEPEFKQIKSGYAGRWRDRLKKSVSWFDSYHWQLISQAKQVPGRLSQEIFIDLGETKKPPHTHKHFVGWQHIPQMKVLTSWIFFIELKTQQALFRASAATYKLMEPHCGTTEFDAEQSLNNLTISILMSVTCKL